MKINVPLFIIIASAILIIVNFITCDTIDNGFWLRILSSILIIFSMVLTIRANRKNENK
mgnify:CR=1 FL=1